MTVFDIGIVGMGTAGATALLKILENNNKKKIAIFDAGRPSQKRRHQVYGFLGTFPGSDGKLYLNDLESIISISGKRKTNAAQKWVLSQFSNFVEMNLQKDRKISATLEKKLQKKEYNYYFNDFYQLYPKDIHNYSRWITKKMEECESIFSHFDDEIISIEKVKNHFVVSSEAGDEVHCRKLILSVGRGGWRWAGEIFNQFGIIEDNNTANFGIRIEVPTTHLKDFNKANLTLRKDKTEIGPLSWEGTVIPEDHLDMAITSYRSNEPRWHSDKVSFNLIGEHHKPNEGWQQTNRIGNLTFLVGNDRMMKEKISLLFNKKSKLSIIKEYDFLLDEIVKLNEIMPDIIERGSFYAPTLRPWAPKISVGSDFSTEVPGLYVAGETAGVPGILGALISGSIVADALS